MKHIPTFQQFINESDAVNELNFSRADRVLDRELKRPKSKSNIGASKLTMYLDRFVSQPFDYEDLEHFLNSLEVTPEELDVAMDSMRERCFSLDLQSDNGAFTNLEVYSDNYHPDSHGVAFMWDEYREKWSHS